MGQPAAKRQRATYADLEAVPPHKVAELVDGVLHVMPRPAFRHARAGGAVQSELFGPFDRGRGGPGGWVILIEPELHFPNPSAPGEVDVVVPDVAGWRRERMPEMPDVAHSSLAPDWICEVLSPSTKTFDREEKMPVYACECVQHAWLVDPIARTLEVRALGPGRRWLPAVTYRDDVLVRAAPFDAIELDLSVLWAK